MKKITKCIIPAAGMGTRFLPATKALPKEMFPIIDKPVMQYLVEEAIDAGCEDIIIITGRSKRAIEDHFDSNPELEARLDTLGKFHYLQKVQYISGKVNIAYVRQPYPKGDGDALLRAKNLIGDEPFLVLFGDDIIDHSVSAARQLVDRYIAHPSHIIGSICVDPDDISKYGIIQTDHRGWVQKFIEKPSIGSIDSSMAAIGKYILTPDIFTFLEHAGSSCHDGEIRLADAFIAMCQQGKDIYAYQIAGNRYDTGNILGYLQACIAYGMKDPEIAPLLHKYCKEIVLGKK